MRRIYYRFPQKIDLSFSLGLSFLESLRHVVAELDGTESTKTANNELVKVRTKVEVALDRATFGEVTPDLLKPGGITESADLRISVLTLALRGGGKVPVANDAFLVRLTDRAKHTDVDIAKEGNAPGLDALDIKNLILGKS
jgi:hypothetical protein